MKKLVLIVFVALALLALLWRGGSPRVEPPPDVPGRAETAPPPATSLAAPPGTGVSPIDETYHPLTAALGTASLSAEKEPEVVMDLLQGFRRAAGFFPTAEDNPGVVRQLQQRRGAIPPLFPMRHPRINEDGALIDPWGTPYFFHHLSRERIELRSAGPDAAMFTEDDVVVVSGE